MTIKRPKCSVEGCNNVAENTGRKNPDGSIKYRWKTGLGWMCSTCHGRIIHRAVKHRKDYCENVDGRLKFSCTTTIVWEGMLDVDHINGDPSDNRIENLQTLCKCCHVYKTHIYKDSQSPGRKSLGLTGYLTPGPEYKHSDTVVFPNAHEEIRRSGLFEFEK